VNRNVGIVIVSHSPDVAKGAADMVRQMVGKDVPLAWCGGDPDGRLGTSVDAIEKALQTAGRTAASSSWWTWAAQRLTVKWR